MLPPTLADFNFKLDNHCFFAEEDSKVMRIARQMDVLDSLTQPTEDTIILSFFYTDKQKILDLALFFAMPGGEPEGRYLCFYFRDFLRVGYDIGARLESSIPPGLINQEEFIRELLPALEQVLEDYAPDSRVNVYRKRNSWAFFYERYKGIEVPCLN